MSYRTWNGYPAPQDVTMEEFLKVRWGFGVAKLAGSGRNIGGHHIFDHFPQAALAMGLHWSSNEEVFAMSVYWRCELVETGDGVTMGFSSL